MFFQNKVVSGASREFVVFIASGLQSVWPLIGNAKGGKSSQRNIINLAERLLPGAKLALYPLLNR
jgi:hypothetical protein